MNVKRTSSILIGTLAVLAAVSVVWFRSAAVEAVYPVERAKAGIFRGFRTRVRSWFRAQEAAGENVRLKREVASLALTLSDAERLEAENARLRHALDYTAKNPGRWLAVEILSEGGAAAGRMNTLRLGRGSRDGIRDGAVVVAVEGLVGRVTAVTPHTATVTLITDPSIAVSCEVEAAARPKMLGVLGGKVDDGRLALHHMRNIVDVAPQSRVLTSGLGGVFPKGLEVGTLHGVVGTEGTVLPAVDFDSLEDVFVRCEK